MKGTPAIYLGRIIDKKHFRAFVYSPHGNKKLINSWDAFEAAMESGVWFSTIEDANLNKVSVEEPDISPVVAKSDSKPKSKPKSKVVKVPEAEESESMGKDNGMVFEVTDENR